MEKVIEAISNFIDVKEEEIQLLQKYFYLSTFKRNEVIIREGQIAEKIGFIIKGAVRGFYYNEKGEEQVVGFLFEDNLLVNFDTLFQQKPLNITAITLEQTEVCWISRADFVSFIQKYPKYEAVLRMILSEELSDKSEHTKLLRIASSRKRYETFCEKNPDLVLRVPLKHIASYLGMSLETLSRIRAGKL
jgi:CRP-like cAMP-binding protein